MPSQVPTFIVCEYQRLADMPDSCARLMRQAEAHSMFLGLTWFDAFTATLADNRWQPRLIALYYHQDMTDAAALIPLWQPKGSRHLESLSNYYSSYYAPLIDAAIYHDRDRLLALFDAFITYLMHQASWITLNLHPMTQSAPWLSQLQLAAKRHRLYVQHYFCFGNWYRQLGEITAADYFTALPSRLRNTLRRKRKQLQAQYHFDVQIAQTTEQLRLAYQQYQQVYANSWKRAESHPDFIARLLKDYAATGQLRLGVLTVNGEAAAAQIWIVVNKTASIYKLAYNEKFAAYSVGSLLSEAMFRHVVDQDKVDEIDYLSGDDDYKKDWMNQRRERWGLLLINRNSIGGMIWYARHAIPAAIKRWRSKPVAASRER